jgi:hypothetical protein
MTEEKKPEEYPIKENNLNEISSEIIDVEKEVFKKVEQKEPEESKIIKQEKIEREKEESKETGKTETKENFLSRLRRKKLKEQFYPNINKKDILLPNSRSKKEIIISKKSYIILIIIIATLTILLALSVVWRNLNTNKLIELISEKEFSVTTGDTNVTIQPAQITDADTNNNFYNYTINNTINCPEVVCNCA